MMPLNSPDPSRRRFRPSLAPIRSVLQLATLVLCALWIAGPAGDNFAAGQTPGRRQVSSEEEIQKIIHELEAMEASEREATLPDYRLGEKLKGYDLSLLRSTGRVKPFRHAVEEMKIILTRYRGENPDALFQLHFSCVVEFGSKSGMAEIQLDDSLIPGVIRELVVETNVDDLLSISGKIRLKDRIVNEIDAYLTTSRVRQIYYTDFFILPVAGGPAS
jgi:hypothetical protein